MLGIAPCWIWSKRPVLGKSGILLLNTLLLFLLEHLKQKIPKFIEFNASEVDTYLLCLCASYNWGSRNTQVLGFWWSFRRTSELCIVTLSSSGLLGLQLVWRLLRLSTRQNTNFLSCLSLVHSDNLYITVVAQGLGDGYLGSIWRDGIFERKSEAKNLILLLLNNVNKILMNLNDSEFKSTLAGVVLCFLNLEDVV